jgi:site-specific recombinase XerD
MRCYADHSFADPTMQTEHAIRLLRDVCAVRHLSLNTEQSYTQWLRRYAAFLKLKQRESFTTTEQKFEAFLTSLAHSGVSASTQNQIRVSHNY